MNKYKLHLNENQVRQVLTALDFYSRISMGQLRILKEFISDSASEKTLIKLQKEMFPKLTGLNHSFGIAGKQTTEEAKVCYDIYKKIMFVFNPIGVYAYEPHTLSKEGLPYFEQLITTPSESTSQSDKSEDLKWKGMFLMESSLNLISFQFQNYLAS